MSPTARTLAECRKRGWRAAVVERWNPYARRRIDLFGVIDIVALSPTGIVAIQACTAASHSDRLRKVLAEENTAHWIKAGGAMQVWSWGLKGAKGTRKRYALRVATIVCLIDGDLGCL